MEDMFEPIEVFPLVHLRGAVQVSSNEPLGIFEGPTSEEALRDGSTLAASNGGRGFEPGQVGLVVMVDDCLDVGIG